MPDGAFYLYVNCAGLIGETTPAGNAPRRRRRCRDVPARKRRRRRRGRARAYGLSPYLPAVDRDLAARCSTRARIGSPAPSPSCVESTANRKRRSCQTPVSARIHRLRRSTQASLPRCATSQLRCSATNCTATAAASACSPTTSRRRMAGTAVTVRTRGGDNLAILRAFEFCRPGDVMVIDADGDLANALVGGILTFYAAPHRPRRHGDRWRDPRRRRNPRARLPGLRARRHATAARTRTVRARSTSRSPSAAWSSIRATSSSATRTACSPSRLRCRKGHRKGAGTGAERGRHHAGDP